MSSAQLKGDSKNIPLHKLVIWEKENEVENKLRDSSVDVTAKDKTEDGNTPLHYAARTGNLKIANLLINKNPATVNIENSRGKTPLHLAASHDNVMVATRLIDKKADITKADLEGLTPFLTAAKFGSAQVVDILLGEKVDVQERDKKGQTALHLAAENNQLDVLEVLLSCEKDCFQRVKEIFNAKDEDQRTPIHTAAQKGHTECLNLLIKTGADVYQTCQGEKTALHLAAMNGWIDVVAQLIKSWKELIDKTDENKETALHLAVIHDQKKIVEQLLEAGADVNARDKDDRAPISFATEKGLVKCTRLLLNSGAKINLDGVTAKGKLKTPVQYAAENGHSDIVRILATEQNADLTQTYTEKRNCLELAIDNDHIETVSTIIQTDQWDEVLRNSTGFQTPMRKLIRKMPDAAREVFNRCCTKIGKNNDEYEFNYEFLDDTLLLGSWNKDAKVKVSEGEPYTRSSTEIKSNHPLMIMVTSKRMELLDHPLVSALIRRKWSSIGFKYHFINCVIFAIYLAVLTGFALDVNAPYQFTNISAAEGGVCSEQIVMQYKMPKFAAFAKYCVIIFVVLELLLEILEMKQMYSCEVHNYIRKKENVLEWVMCITSVLFVININDCSDSGYRHPWQWMCGTISVFLAWINLVFLIQKFNWVGIYVVMLYRIAKVFMKFFIVFSLLIIAFALTFHCLLRNQEQFGTFWISLVKTTAMMIGELDFGTIFFDDEVHYVIISYIFFYGFMLFMTIVVINLLVGLAVENIQEFQAKADLTKKEMQVQFALELERLSTSSLFRKCVAFLTCCTEDTDVVQKTEIISTNNLTWLRRRFAESWKLSGKDIEAALNPETDGASREIARLDTEIRTFKAGMKSKMKRMDSNLMTILQNLKRLEEMINMINNDEEEE